MHKSLLLSLIIGSAFVSIAAGQQPGPKSRVGSPDVWLVVQEILADLRLVSAEMGVSVPKPLGVRYVEAAPREVFFLAASMLEKTRALTLDMKLRPPSRVAMPFDAIGPLHVMGIAQQTLAAVHDVKRLLAITHEHESQSRNEAKTTADVLAAVSETNRLLNAIIEAPTRPRDVFRQVSLAIRYLRATSICVGMKLKTPQQPFVRLRRPADVYVRLLGCFERVRAIMAGQGVGTLRIDASKLNKSLIFPSDVLDIAVLLVAELKRLDEVIGKGEPQRPVRHTGLCFPSHVHQRAAQLDAMLTEFSRGLPPLPRLSPRPPEGRSR